MLQLGNKNNINCKNFHISENRISSNLVPWKKKQTKPLLHLVFVFFFKWHAWPVSVLFTVGAWLISLLMLLFPHLLSPYILFGRNCPLGRAVKLFQKQIHLVCSPSLKSNTLANPGQSCPGVATQVKHKAEGGGGEGRGRDQVLLELFCLLVHLCVGRNRSPTDL